MPSITALQARVDYDDSAVTQGVPRTQGHLQRFASAVGGVGQLAGVAFAGVGAAAIGMAAGVGSSINAAAGFQQSMADVSALLGGTEQDMKLLSDAALQLGMDATLSGIGATDAAKAMQELAASGFNAGEIAGGAAKGVLLLASATGTDIPTAAQIAGDAFNQFRTSMGLTADFMPTLADLFAGAANASSISLTDIGESMKYIGPVAAGMGISIQDVTATIAALGNQGIKGSSAGTALRSMLVSLADPSKEAAGLIKDLGLQFFDSQGKIKDFSGISEELKTKLAGLTDQQRASALATMFGKEALSAATVLYGEGADGIKKYLDEITKTGIAADTGATRNNTLKGSLSQLKSAFETAQIALGQAFLPALKSLADAAAKAVSAAIPFIQQYGPVLVGWLQQGIGILTQWGGAIWGAVSAVVGAFQSFTSGQTTLAQFIGGMEIFAQTILGKLGGLASAAAPYIGQFFSMIGGAIATYGPQLLAQMGIWAGYLVDWITGTALPWLLPKLAAFGQALVGWLTGTAVPWLVGAVSGLATALSDWITTTAIPFLQTNLPIWLTALGDWLTGTAFPAVVAFITPLAEAFGTWVAETAVPFLLANVPQWIGALVGWWYGTAIPTALRFLVELGQKFGTWVSETAVPYLQENIPLWLVALGTYIRGTAMPAILTGLTAVGKQFGDWVTQTAVPYLLAKIPEWLAALGGWITGTAIPAMLSAAQGIGSAIVNGVVNGLTGGIGRVVGAAQSLVNAIPDVVKKLLDIHSPSRVMAEIGRNTVMGLVEGMDATQQDAVKKAAEVASAVAKAVTDVLGASRVLAHFGAADTPSAGQLSGFAALARAMVTSIQDAAADFTDKGLAAASAFAEAASKVGGSVKNSLDGLKALATYDFANNSPTGSAMGWFTHLISSLVANFARAAQEFDAEALTAAGQFADAAGKVGGSVTNSLTGLKALAGADFAVTSPSGSAMGWFTHLTASLTQNFADAARDFAEGALTAASQFAEAAGKVAGVVKPALDGFAGMATLVTPSQAAIDSFMESVRYLVQRFADIATMLNDEGIKHLSAFSDAAAKSLAAAKTGVDLFTGMAKLALPSTKAVDDLVGAIGYVVRKFAEMATLLNDEGLKQLTAFSDGAAKSLGAAKTGVDLFTSMAKLTLPSVDAVNALVGAIGYVVQSVRTMAQTIGAEGIAQAVLFGSAVVQVTTSIKNALETMAGLSKLKDLPANALAALKDALDEALAQMAEREKQAHVLREGAERFLADMRTAATKIGEGMALWGDAQVPADATTGGTGGGTTNPGPSLASSVTSGGSRGNTVNVTVTGNTLLGNSPETAADLARILTPELARVVQAGY